MRRPRKRLVPRVTGPLLTIPQGGWPGAEADWPAPREARRPGVLIDWRYRGYRIAPTVHGVPYFVGRTRHLAVANSLADCAIEVLDRLKAERPDLFIPKEP